MERYRRLWDEISREQVIHPDERYRIQERIRALNALGILGARCGDSEQRTGRDAAASFFHH